MATHPASTKMPIGHRELAGAVLRSLLKVLREALAPDGKPAGNTYPLTVNYGMSVEDVVRLSRYDRANSDINSRNFPMKREETVDITLELIHVNRAISTDDALREFDRRNMRPAELHELLAFGEKYHEVQREFPVIALGSEWLDRHGYRCVPYLCRVGSERYLDLAWIGEDWEGRYRFAAVRK